MEKSEFEKIKPKLKAGILVTCKFNGRDMKPARIVYIRDDIYMCYTLRKGGDPKDVFDYEGATEIKFHLDEIEDLKIVEEKTLYNLKVGDVVVSEYDREHFILAVLGGDVNPVYILSYTSCETLKESLVDKAYTAYKLKEYGYKVKQEELTELTELTEVTLEDIAKWKGVDVEDVRIKD